MKNATTKPDIERILTCAALATLTTLGLFSLIVNLMAPLFASVALLTAHEVAQQTATHGTEQRVCQTTHVDDPEDLRRPSVI